ncbi:hypothetical protein B0H13DRAFT_2333312 [Mycena leptocephala]|nr:hypothetical protein B0H13DRAFT_2333312 [Mycena leptocephala]
MREASSPNARLCSRCFVGNFSFEDRDLQLQDRMRALYLHTTCLAEAQLSTPREGLVPWMSSSLRMCSSISVLRLLSGPQASMICCAGIIGVGLYACKIPIILANTTRDAESCDTSSVAGSVRNPSRNSVLPPGSHAADTGSYAHTALSALDVFSPLFFTVSRLRCEGRRQVIARRGSGIVGHGTEGPGDICPLTLGLPSFTASIRYSHILYGPNTLLSSASALSLRPRARLLFVGTILTVSWLPPPHLAALWNELHVIAFAAHVLERLHQVGGYGHRITAILCIHGCADYTSAQPGLSPFCTVLTVCAFRRQGTPALAFAPPLDRGPSAGCTVDVELDQLWLWPHAITSRPPRPEIWGLEMLVMLNTRAPQDMCVKRCFSFVQDGGFGTCLALACASPRHNFHERFPFHHLNPDSLRSPQVLRLRAPELLIFDMLQHAMCHSFGLGLRDDVELGHTSLRSREKSANPVAAEPCTTLLHNARLSPSAHAFVSVHVVDSSEAPCIALAKQREGVWVLRRLIGHTRVASVFGR